MTNIQAGDKVMFPYLGYPIKGTVVKLYKSEVYPALDFASIVTKINEVNQLIVIQLGRLMK